jgi:1-acyl-sn-glycerol-3-phosphate acyltransferase
MNPFLLLHSLFGWVATAVLLAVLSFVAWLLAPFASDPCRHYHRWARIWARAVLAACRVRVDVEDREVLEAAFRSGSLVLACNHQSFLDIPILLAHLPEYFAFISKVEVFGVPLLGSYMEVCGFIKLKRGDRPGSREALSNAVAAIEQGRSVLVFPEGTRSATGSLGAFKRGAALLALRTGRPVLPLSICGSRLLLPRETFIARPGSVTLRAAAPIVPSAGDVPAATGDDGPETVFALTERVRQRVGALLARRAAPVAVGGVARETKA